MCRLKNVQQFNSISSGDGAVELVPNWSRVLYLLFERLCVFIHRNVVQKCCITFIECHKNTINHLLRIFRHQK